MLISNLGHFKSLAGVGTIERSGTNYGTGTIEEELVPSRVLGSYRTWYNSAARVTKSMV